MIILRRKIIRGFQFLFFLGLGLLLFWLLYRDQDIDRVKAIVKRDVRYFWIGLSLVLALLSHLSRTRRWILMIEPLGKKPAVLPAFLSVMIGYFMNLVVPRMGEVSRSGVLSRISGVPFTGLIGTVVAERVIDLLMLLLFTLLVILLQFGEIIQFLNNNPDIRQTLEHTFFSLWVPGLLAVASIATAVFWRRIRSWKFYAKVRGLLGNFVDGLKTIRGMKHKGEFIFHSCFIWLMYYLMLYVCFFSFGFTSGLPAVAGLTAFVLGSYGMVAPVQGGIGAWHFMVIQALLVYGVDKSDAGIFAFLVHFFNTAMIVVAGAISLITLPLVGRKVKMNHPINQ